MRLAAALRTDVTMQYRHGFYAVSVLLILILGLLFRQLHLAPPGWFFPALVSANLLLTCFFFIGALVLLEKDEGVLFGIATSPLRDGEYLASKVVTLSALAVAETALLIAVGFGPSSLSLQLLMGAAALAALYSLLGFAVIAPRESFNDYFLPAIATTILFLVAVLGLPGLIPAPYAHLHPVFPSLVLMQAGRDELQAWELLYAVIGSVVWPILAALVALRVHRHTITPKGRYYTRASGRGTR